MKKILSFFLLFSLFFSLKAQDMSTELQESLSMESKILGRSVEYSVWVPPGYFDTNRRYPVTYVLHGYTDDETGWVQFGEIDRLAEEAIATGEIPPMILAMPDAGLTYYVNDSKGKVRYEDFFIQEFIPHIEANYRVRAKKEFRGVTGLSMGGYGSFLYAAKHPDLFAAAAPLSGAFYTESEVISFDQGRWDYVEAPMYGKGLAGKDRITDHWKANNPYYLIENTDVDKLKSVRWWFDCGDDDFLYEGNAMMHIALRKKEIPHEFRMREGGHSWQYWRDGIIPALKFIGESFRR